MLRLRVSLMASQPRRWSHAQADHESYAGRCSFTAKIKVKSVRFLHRRLREVEVTSPAQQVSLVIRAALSDNAMVATQLALLSQQLQAISSSQLNSFPADSDLWQVIRLEVTAPHQSPMPCQPSCKIINGRGRV